jgi:hypothetical protein
VHFAPWQTCTCLIQWTAFTKQPAGGQEAFVIEHNEVAEDVQGLVESPIVAHWRKLLIAARLSSMRVTLDSEIEITTNRRDANGRRVAVPAMEEDADVRVAAVNERTFNLGFPLESRTGITVVVTPFSVVKDIWDGEDGSLHVLLNYTIRVTGKTSRFVRP